MPCQERCAYVVDDEVAVRRSVGLLLRAAGYGAESFESGEAFLRAACDGLRPGCVLLDLRMPGLDGLDVQRQITARRLPHPVVIITAHGDVPLAVAAMKAGACDFVEKPFAGETILRAADAAMRRGDAALAQANEAAEAAARLATLSPREADVLRGVVSGRQNKVIARHLGISPRTVEIYRGNVMSKLGARSVPEAMRVALAGGFTAAHPE
jgi:two-component system response regulator FixJ